MQDLEFAVELKSRHGQCSPSQRLAREAPLRAGAQWWVCRSATAAIWAVVFCTIVYDNGTLESWEQPALPPW